MKITISYASMMLLFCLTKGGLSFSKVNNYAQIRRSQKFMQVSVPSSKMGSSYAEDLDELDAYEFDNELQKANSSNSLEFNDLQKHLNSGNDWGLDVDEAIQNRMCTVNEEGNLNIIFSNNNFFDQQEHFVRITANSIEIRDPLKSEDVLRNISFDSIMLPIETIAETRECWNIKTNKEKIVLCERNSQGRDMWVHNILKALFCYNTSHLSVQEMQFNSKDKNTLPKESTVEKRMQEKRIHLFNQINENKNINNLNSI